MAQVTLYLDEGTLQSARLAADSAGVSLSAWLGALVRDRTRAAWPEHIAALAGSWRDVEPVGCDVPVADLPRETL